MMRSGNTLPERKLECKKLKNIDSMERIEKNCSTVLEESAYGDIHDMPAVSRKYLSDLVNFEDKHSDDIQFETSSRPIKGIDF